MNKLISVFIITILLFSSFPMINSEYQPQDEPAFFSMEPESYIGEFIQNKTINISIKVDPNGTTIDTVSTELITFPEEVMECTDITWGNLFSSSIFRYMGTIDNENGTITGTTWGSSVSTTTEGYFINLTFRLLNEGSGHVTIDETEAGMAYAMEDVSFIIQNEFDISTGSILLFDEYPPHQSAGHDENLQLKINVTHTNEDPITMYWKSNVTGEEELLGIENQNGSGRYNMSCYGVIDSPYNQTVVFDFSDYSTPYLLNNTVLINGNGLAKDIGTINKVYLGLSQSGSATIQPYFEGYIPGNTYSIMNTIEITDAPYAPTEWDWDDIKNLDLKISNLNGVSSDDFEIGVVYDLGFGEGIKVDWSVNVTDTYTWKNESYWYKTELVTPKVSNEQPYDAEVLDTFNPTLSVDVVDPNGDEMDVSFWSDKSGDWEQIGSTQTGHNGTYTQNILFDDFSETCYWKINVSDGINHIEKTYRFRIRDEYTPDSSSITAQAYCDGQINLSWTIPENADNIIIKRRIDTYPQSPSDGITIYQGSSTSFIDYSVNPATTYYYAIWSHNDTDDAWSSENDTVSEVTAPLPPSTFIAESTGHDKMELSWSLGEGEYVEIRKSTSDFPQSPNDGEAVYYGNLTSYTDTNLGGNTTYYYSAWSSNSLGLYDPKYKNEGNQSHDTIYTDSDYNFPYSDCVTHPPSDEFMFDPYYNPISQSFTIEEGEYYNLEEIELGLRPYRGGGHTWDIRYVIAITGNGLDENLGSQNPPDFYPYDLTLWGWDSIDADVYLTEGTYTIDIQAWVSHRVCYSPKLLWITNDDGKFYRLYGTYGYKSCTFSTTQNTTDVGPPSVSTLDAESVTNNNASIYGRLNANGGEATTVGFLWENETGTQNTTVGILSNGNFDLFITGLNKGETYNYTAWASNKFGYIQSSTKKFNTKPYSPMNLTTFNITPTSAEIMWNKSQGMDSTAVSINNSTYPIEKDFLIGLNQTQFTDLIENQTYYVRIWGYNESEELYSTDYDEIQFTTAIAPPSINSNAVTNIQNTSVTLHATVIYDGGENCTAGFRYGTSSGSYTQNITVGTNYSATDTLSQMIDSLQIETKYYYQSWIKNSGGFYADGEENFNTNPSEPNSFHSSSYGARQINLSWSYNGTVMIRKSDSINPQTTSEGTQIYFGEENNCRDFPLNENSTWYYSIWSYDSENGQYSVVHLETRSTTEHLPKITYAYPNNVSNLDRKLSLEATATDDQGRKLDYTFYGYGDEAPKITGDWATGRQYTNPSTSHDVYFWDLGTLESLYGKDRTVDIYNLLETDENKTNFYGEHQPYGTSPSWSSWQCSTWGPLKIGFGDKEETVGKKITSVHINNTLIKKSSECYMYTILKYHDYYTDEWTSIRHEIVPSYREDEWESHMGYELNEDLYNYEIEPTVVDQIEIYYGAHWEGQPGSPFKSRMETDIYSVTFTVPPTELVKYENVNSGTVKDVLWNNATKQNKEYSWSLLVENGIDEIFENFYFKTEGMTLSNETPSDGTTNLPDIPDYDCSVQVNHSGGETMNISFYYYNYSLYNFSYGGSYNNTGNGTYNWTYPDGGELSKTYTWKVCVQDSYDWLNETYDFRIRNPDYPISDFSLNGYNTTQINITSITGGSSGDYVMLRWDYNEYPSSRTDGYHLFTGTQSSYLHQGLTPDTTYYYSLWGYNETDDVWGNPRQRYATTDNVDIPTFIPVRVNKSFINITAISINDEYSDTVMIRYKLNSYPENRTDGLFLTNSSQLYYEHEGLSSATQYYYKAWAYDNETGTWSESYSASQQTNGGITLNLDPYDGEHVQGINPPLIAYVNDYNNDQVSVTIQTNESGGWTTIYSKTGPDGKHQYNSTEFDIQGATYYWRVITTDGEFWKNNTNSFTTGSINTSDVHAETINTTEIKLSWNKSRWTTDTWIQRKKDDYPSSRTDGTTIYFGNGTQVNDTNLETGELYRYAIWGYNETLDVYSIDSTYTQNVTKPEAPTNFTAEKINHKSINLTWDKGYKADGTVIIYKPDNYPVNLSDGTIKYEGNNTQVTVTDLKPNDYNNYFTPVPGEDNFGVYLGGGDPFNNSCDDDLLTKWDLNESTTGNFTYETGLLPQRIKGFAFNYQDFYDEPGTDWEAAITKVEIFNGTWNTAWEGKITNDGTEPQWYYHETPDFYANATKIRVSAWTEWITPNLYEVKISKLGYKHCFSAWSSITKGGITQYSEGYDTANNLTNDTPVNLLPEISNMTPVNNSDDIDKIPEFSVDLIEREGDSMSISWQYYNDADWIQFNHTSLVGNGTYYAKPSTPFEYNKSFLWRVVVTDDAELEDSAIQTNTNTSEVLNFTTRNAYYPETPTSLSASTYDYRTINLTYSYNSDGIYIERNLMENWTRGNGTYLILTTNKTTYNDTFLSDNTTYFYRAWGYNQTDNKYSNNSLLTLNTTQISPNDAPHTPFDPYPHEEPYMDVYDIVLECNVSDPDGENLNVSFYWGDDTLIGTLYERPNNSRVTFPIANYIEPDWISHDTNHTWYVIVSDAEEETATSPTWWFKTCKAWDLNVDKIINYLDISIVVSHYLDTCTPGSESWDINNDGLDNYLDLSSVVGNYLESY